MFAHELKQRIPDAELILTLEPEELAGILLPILRKEGASYQGKISGYNLLNGFRQMQEIYPRQAVPAVTRAIMEAWNWMLNNGLLAPVPDDNSGDWVFLTRAAEKLQAQQTSRSSSKQPSSRQNFCTRGSSSRHGLPLSVGSMTRPFSKRSKRSR